MSSACQTLLLWPCPRAPLRGSAFQQRGMGIIKENLAAGQADPLVSDCQFLLSPVWITLLIAYGKLARATGPVV